MLKTKSVLAIPKNFGLGFDLTGGLKFCGCPLWKNQQPTNEFHMGSRFTSFRSQSLLRIQGQMASSQLSSSSLLRAVGRSENWGRGGMSTVKAVSTGQLKKKKKIGNSILSLYFVYAFFFWLLNSLLIRPLLLRLFL